MSQQSGDPVADLIRVNTVVQAVVGNGNQLVNSGDNQGELQRPDLLQSTPPPALRAAPDVRRQPTPGSSTRTRGRFVRMGPVKVSGK